LEKDFIYVFTAFQDAKTKNFTYFEHAKIYLISEYIDNKCDLVINSIPIHLASKIFILLHRCDQEIIQLNNFNAQKNPCLFVVNIVHVYP